MRAAAALRHLLAAYSFETVLDVGSGAGDHARAFSAAGKRVTTNDLRQPTDLPGDFLAVEIAEKSFDAVWCSHVLEHQRNVGLFLEKVFRVLRPAGVFAVTVPPAKPQIVGGHLTLWNAGLLLYNLVVAGWDCRAAEVRAEGYDVSVVVRRGPRPLSLPPLAMDAGDIELLAEFFPLPVRQGFDGNLTRLNWPE